MRPPEMSSRLAEMAPIFDELTFWSSRFGALLFDNLELRPDIRGLDLGCATGFPLIELAMVHGPSCEFVGIDLWQEALAIARAKIAFYQLQNVKAIAADAASLPFVSGAFDLVISNLGLNNFEDVPAVLAEARRVLAPGGRVVFTTNVTGTTDELYRVLEEIVARLRRSRSLCT